MRQALLQRRFDQAISLLEGLRPLGRWQALVPPLLDAQIGMILYSYKEQADKALPYLERAPLRQWQAKAMLAAIYFRRRDYTRMVQVFEKTVRRNRKAGMLWSAYAWCEQRRGAQQQAVDVLARARRYLPRDERISRNLLALQNNKKMKMHAYAEEWWAMRLQRPPAQQPAIGGRRVAIRR